MPSNLASGVTFFLFAHPYVLFHLRSVKYCDILYFIMSYSILTQKSKQILSDHRTDMPWLPSPCILSRFRTMERAVKVEKGPGLVELDTLVVPRMLSGQETHKE